MYSAAFTCQYVSNWNDEDKSVDCYLQNLECKYQLL